MSLNLSKSRYCSAVQCPKMLWLKKNKPEEFDDSVMNETLKMLYEFDRNTNYTLYPGHGQTSTMVEERQFNPYLRYAAGLRTR